MASLRVVSTAEVLSVGDTAHMGGSSLGLTRAPAGSFPLLERLVALTVRAERFLARCAEAEAHAGCGPFEGSDRFINDAAGGAFRSAEAARSLRAQGG